MTNRRAYQRYRTNLFLVLMAVFSVVVIWGLAQWQNTRVSARSRATGGAGRRGERGHCAVAAAGGR